MIKATWNKATQSYTVSGKGVTVRGIPTKTQADAVKMEIRHGWSISFGEVAEVAKGS